MQSSRATTRSLMTIVVTISLGCSDLSAVGLTYGPLPQPPAPPVVPPTAPPNPVGSPPPFPAVLNAKAIYAGPDHLYDQFMAYHGSSLPSRYVLFSDSTFQLQFASYRFGVVTYSGRYVPTDTTFNFTWTNEGGPPWDAVGILQEVTLHIRYSLDMQMSDFLDGAYVLVR